MEMESRHDSRLRAPSFVGLMRIKVSTACGGLSLDLKMNGITWNIWVLLLEIGQVFTSLLSSFRWSLKKDAWSYSTICWRIKSERAHLVPSWKIMVYSELFTQVFRNSAIQLIPPMKMTSKFSISSPKQKQIAIFESIYFNMNGILLMRWMFENI